MFEESFLWRTSSQNAATLLKWLFMFRLHYQLQETEGLPVSHGWAPSWFPSVSSPAHFLSRSVLFPLFSHPLLQMWLDWSRLFISLPATLPSDYSPALLTVFSNPFVQISQTYIGLSQLLICSTPLASAVTQRNLYGFETCSCVTYSFHNISLCPSYLISCLFSNSLVYFFPGWELLDS